MGDLCLPIFPEDTLATSITTTVLVGVWVVVFFNLRLGWVLSGLVVPGYLVPLLITKPMSAGVILVEAFLTYGLVWFASEGFKRRAFWSSFFGRDRFFALVVASILVRVVLDGWLLPAIGPFIQELVGGNFDHQNHFHSYGLIIVALIANSLWKPGLLRGVVPLVVTVGTTYLIVRFVLIETTNFHVGSLQYLYEDVASSLLASPKSYIILVTTAFVASWMNLRYSWDYNGILVPSLLALQWYQPWKIVTSFVEAFIILVLARALLKLPIWRHTTIEGGRKVLLFFNLAFLYRLALCYLIPLLLPNVKVTDAYGFGYLLSTLLAIRAYEKNLLIHVSRAAIQVSLVGAVAGSFLGFALLFLPSVGNLSVSANTTADTTVAFALEEDLVSVLRRDKLTLYRQRIPDNFVPPTAADLQWFQEGLRRLQAYLVSRDDEELSAARQALARANYTVQLLEQRYLYLRERAPARGWGLYALDLKKPHAVVVEVPAPLDEWSTIEAGLCIFQRLEGSALAVAGASRRLSAAGAADVLSNPLTIYGVFHRQTARGNVLEVRGQTREHERKFRQMSGSGKGPPSGSSLWIKNAIPTGCKLDKVRQLLADWDLRWRTTPLANVLRDNTRSGFAELVVTRHDRRALLATLLSASPDLTSTAHVDTVNLSMREWLLDRKQDIGERGSNRYRPARLEEMLYLDELVVKPLMHLIGQAARYSDLTAAEQGELQAIAAAAALLDYRLIVLSGEGRGADFLALAAAAEQPGRCWGIYVFRFGTRDSHVVQVPRPLYERNTFEFAVNLFDRLPAAALLIAGAHPGANVDGSADVIRLNNKVNMFNLVHQVLLRERGPRPMMVISVRAIRAPVDAEVIVAMADGTRRIEDATPLQQELLNTLEADRMVIQYADGTRQVAGYEVGVNPQFAVLAQSENKEFTNLWLSPSLRRTYRQDSEDRLLESQFLTLGIPTVTADMYEHLRRWPSGSRQCEVPAALRRLVVQFIRHRDIVCLRKAQCEFQQFHLTRLVDRTSRQAFLLIERPGSGMLPAVASLSEPRDNESGTVVSADDLRPHHVQHFINSCAAWLEVERKP